MNEIQVQIQKVVAIDIISKNVKMQSKGGSMKLYLKYRFSCLLWMVWIKRRLNVKGQNIPFAVIPRFLFHLGTKSDRNTTAFVWTYKKTGALMIFVSSEKAFSPNLRLMLYHEHLEGLYSLGSVSGNAVWKEKFYEALSYLTEGLNHEAKAHAWRVFERSDRKAHHFALALELALAKKEMSQSVFTSYLAHALRNRF